MNADTALLHAIIDTVKQLRSSCVAARNVLTLIPDGAEPELERYLMDYCDDNETLQLRLMTHGRVLFSRLMKEMDSADATTETE